MTRVNIGVVVRKQHGNPSHEALQGTPNKVVDVNKLADPTGHKQFVNKVFALVRP